MIKAIIFDCFGVLTQDGWKAFLASLPPGAGVETAKKLNHQYDAGLISLEKFLEGVQAATGHDFDVITSARSSEDAKNAQLVEYIRGLKKNYKIGMISNVATNWVRDYLLTTEEQKLFDVMVFSFEVGTTKPDPRIYEEALSKLGVVAQDCVFVDDVERYCEAARVMGMKAVLYQDFEQMKTDMEKVISNQQ
ncbi:MAG: HAD family phosphatase [bacterium]|nr:HAD family phosphatase [bacterium]